MSVDQDLERAVRGWVAQGSERLPDPALDAALREISLTPQRRAGWLARRFPIMNSNRLRFSIAAVAIIAAGLIGLRLLPGNVGGPATTSPPLDSRVTGPWMPDPLDPGIGFEASTEAACRGAFEVAEDLPVRHPQEVIGAPLVLVDARGQGIVHALFAREDGTGGVCWNGEVAPQDGVRAAEYSLLLSFAPDPEPVAEQELCMNVVQPHAWNPSLTTDAIANATGWTVAGRAGSAVASVTIETPDAGIVTPTFRDGWFLAWWPGGDKSYAIVGKNRDGDEIARFEPHSLPADDWPCSDVASAQTPTASQSPVTLALGSFTAPLLASGVTTVDIDAVGVEPRLRGSESRSATPASGSMEVSDADGRFSVEVECTRWAEELLIGGEVIDSTHGAAAEGSRVVIALHPRTVISALLWFEDAAVAPTCEGFLEGISIPIDVSNEMEPVVGVMRVGTYAADCDGGACTELDR
jgi:hypothetical protein